jgi:signal transduction histidine kinase
VALQPGNYVFEVIPINHAGLPIAEPLRQSILIKPAWYQTILFKAVVILAVVLLVFFVMRLYYNFRLKLQKREYEQVLVIQKERQRISSEMHDDIGASLSSVRLLTEMTKNKLKDTGITNEIDNIYQSVGDISTKMQEVIWSLNSENDHLNNLIYFIQKQVRSLLEHYPGKLIFELPADIPDIGLNGEIRRNIYLVVKEAVHNSMKHSGADKIRVTITCKEKLVITVSDNGKGMRSENYIAGNGWKNMQQRMKKLNGVFLSKNEEGLSLIFEIPIKPIL